VQFIISLIVIVFLSLGVFFIYEKEHKSIPVNETPQVLKQISLNVYSSESQWNITGNVLVIKGTEIKLQHIKATNPPYIIVANEGLINKESGKGYLKGNVVFSKQDKSDTDKLYTQYTNINLKSSHFWANNDVIISNKHFASYGKAFDIHLKPYLDIIVYNIKSYEK